MIAGCGSFYNSTIQERPESLFVSSFSQGLKNKPQCNAGLVKCALAPVADCKVNPGFRYFFRDSQAFIEGWTFANKILGNFLSTGDLLCTPEPTGQGSASQDQLGLGILFQASCFWSVN